MPTWKKIAVKTLSTTLLLTQGGPLPYLALAADSAHRAPINGEVTFSWTTSDQVNIGAKFNPYDGLTALDADGDNVAVLTKVSGEVDTTKEGVYPITYSIDNVDGKTFKVTRQVTVVHPHYLSNETPQGNQSMENSDGEKVDEPGHIGEDTEAPSESETPENSDSSSNTSQDEVKESKLKEARWSLYDHSQQHELMSLMINTETGYYEGHIPEGLTTNLSKLEDSNWDQELLSLKILSKDDKEKLSLTLTIRDLLGESDVLKALNELKYEMGDQLHVTPLLTEETTFVVHGVQGGHISNEKAEYETGVKDADYLHNVRFQLTDEGLQTIYNEAPIIEGIEDIEVSDVNSFDPKKGVTVQDDHDSNLLSNLKVTLEQQDEHVQFYKYQVTDSWGRTTEGNRKVTVTINDESLENSPTNHPNYFTQSSTSLADTTIDVGGRKYIGDDTHDLDTRFKIKFDPTSKEIKLIDQDGRQMNPSYKESDYFKFALYDKNMNLKASVTLAGKDTSDSEKLNAIKNRPFEIGDYISLWHVKTDDKNTENTEKMKVTGSELIQGETSVSYEQGIPYKEISEQRYQITSEGLSIVTNTAPTLKEGDSLSDLSLNLNQNIDLALILRDKLADDKDDVKKLNIKYSEFSTSAAGTHNMTYTVTDSWGAKAEFNQKITVSSSNTLDNTDFEIYTASNEHAFTMTFNTTNNKIVVSKNKDVQLNPSDEGVVFRLKFIRDNITQRTLSLKGTDMTADIVKSKLSDYRFEIGDEIEIWSSYPDNGIRIKGDIRGIPEGGENYSDGIQNLDAMNNVRFKITEGETTSSEGEQTKTKDNWLSYEYNKAPVFGNLEPLIVKRTQKPDYLSGVTVTDEDEDIKSKIKYDELTEEQLNTAGDYEIRYRVIDSKGRMTSVVREVIVQPYSTLETQSILVNAPHSDEVLFEVGFDEAVSDELPEGEVSRTEDIPPLKKKLVVHQFSPLTSSTGTKETPGIPEADKDAIVKIVLYNGNGQKQQELELSANQLQDETQIQQIEAWEFKSTDYLYIWSRDYSGIYINSALEGDSNQFSDEDQMVNTRFQLKSEGLNQVYNQAPTFKGLNPLYVYKGTTIDDDVLREGVTVEDEDQNLTFSVEEKENVKSDTIGTYSVSYKVTDSWGRTTQQERSVHVISKATENMIELYNEQNEKIIMFRYNPIKNGFNVTTYPNVVDQNPTREASTNQFTFSLFNNNHQEIYQLQINETDWMTEGFFEGLEEIEMRHGYYFNVVAKDPTKVKISGDIQLDSDIPQDTDYNSGSVDSDYLTNVRFKLTEDGLDTVYNEKPTIYFRTREVFSALAGDPIDYLEGIQIVDDHDQKISTENIKISYGVDEETGNEKTENNLKIGDNKIYYSIADSWGRETTVERPLTIYNGLAKHEIAFYSNPSGNNTGSLNSDDEKFVQIKLKNTSDTGGVLDVVTVGNQIFNSALGNYRNYEFTLYGIGGRKKQEVKSRGNSQANVFDRLNGVNFEYGDYIKLFAWHPYRLMIDGIIENQMEDYSDGVNNPLYLNDVYFQITPSGLKSIYSPSNNPSENQNILIPMSFEGAPLQIKFTPSESGGKITVENTNTYSFWYGDSTEVFKLELYNPNNGTSPRVSLSAHGGTNGTNAKKDWARQYSELNNEGISYNIGDYIKIWHKKHKSALIFGNVQNKHEDYSNGFDSEESMTYTVFKLTGNGLEAVYNEPPTIEGIEDKTIVLGQHFDPLEGVSVTDTLDGTIQNSNINVTGNINVHQLGEQTLTYCVSDSWGRETEVERIITVRPLIDFNYFTFYPVDSTETPAFRLGFDSLTKTYRIWDQNQGRLDSTNTESEIIKIELRRENAKGQEEILKTISLTGNDRGTSEKLNDLNNLPYQEGDILRVYHSSGSSAVTFTNKGTSWETRIEQFSEQQDRLLKNVGFKIVEQQLPDVIAPINNSDSGDSDSVENSLNQIKLEAIYNHAPNIAGVSPTKEVYKGDVVNLLDGISVTDVEDEIIDKAQIQVTVNGTAISSEETGSINYTFNKLGTYTITYQVTDSWGRTTLTTQTITVQSKTRQNSINVYNSNDTLAFKITFDTANNRFDLVGPSQSGGLRNQASESEEAYFNMIVRSMDGTEKYAIQLTGDSSADQAQLETIYRQPFELYDTIELKAQSATAVKLMGSIVGNGTGYETGFGTTDKYGQVRFQITEEGLKELTQPTISITPIAEKIEIPRATTEFDLKSLVQVEGLAENSSDYQITANSDIDFNVEGEYTISYEVTTSWGTTEMEEITVKVIPRNELEKNQLEIYNTANENILTISFDTVTKKLRVIKFDNKCIDEAITGSALRLTAYDESGNIIKTLPLTGNQIITEEIVNRINQFSYEDISRIGIWGKDPKKLKIKGTVINHQEDYSDGIEDDDHMNNVRFEMTDEGLKSVYNAAPNINLHVLGKDKKIYLMKGNQIQIPSGIAVTDDHDGTISSVAISINDSGVDYDKIGEQKMYFEVEDSWGRVAKEQVTLVIQPPLEHTKIKILPLGNATTKLVMSFTNDSKIKFTSEPNEESSTSPTTTESEQNKITIKLYQGSELRKKMEFTGEVDCNEEWEFTPGGDAYLAFENVSEENEKNIQIHGSVNSGTVDYTGGLTDIDLNNTRFRLSDLGIETVYNEAPSITILTNSDDTSDTKLTALKGDVIDFEYNVLLSDDHDDLKFSENVTVTYNRNDVDVNQGFSQGEVGSNTVTYTVTDSWGRTATTTRIIELKNAVDEVKIQMYGHKESDTSETLPDLVLEMTLDSTKKKLMTNIKIDPTQTYYFNKNNRYNTQYQVTLWNLQESTVTNQQLTLHGTTRVTTENGNTTLKKWVEQGNSFNYGDYIQLQAWHQDKLKIQGPVRKAPEDYSDGVQLGDSYSNVYFKITESGLEAVYNDNYDVSENSNLILLSAREGFPMKIRLTPSEDGAGQISFEDLTKYSIQFDKINGRARAFRFTIYSSTGERIVDLKFNKNTNPSDAKNTLKEFISNLNNFTYRNGKQAIKTSDDGLTGTYPSGCYMEIAHITPKNLRIKGNITDAKENYDDGIDNSEYMENVVFQLTAEGLKSIYIGEPQITGVQNLSFESGMTITESDLRQQLLEGIKVDEKTDFSTTLEGENALGAIDYSSLDYSQSSTLRAVTEEKEYQLNNVGFYDVRYSYGLSNSQEETSFLNYDFTNLSQRPRRSTFKRATINVYDNPTIIEVSDNEKPKVIQAGEYRTQEEAEPWLKTLVKVTDKDDLDAPIDIKITYNTDKPFNPMEAGEYDITYTATDSGGHQSKPCTLKVTVVRTISVSVPHQLPFQVVTNLIADSEESPFIAGIMKFTNNTITPVNVYLKSVTKVQDSGSLELVDPAIYPDWSQLSEQETMSKLALGLYPKDGFEKSTLTKGQPKWLITESLPKLSEEKDSDFIGTIPAKVKGATDPSVARLTLTAKHGEMFNFGKAKGKFQVTFEFR